MIPLTSCRPCASAGRTSPCSPATSRPSPAAGWARRAAGFTPEARACLLRYAWPGNVRELANAVERAVVLGDGELIQPEDLPETVLESAPGPDTTFLSASTTTR